MERKKEMFKNELEIDVGRCIGALFKRVKLIIVFAMIFGMIGVGLSLDIGEDRYTANATVYAAASSSYSDAANAVTAMNAYLDVASSYKVSQRAALILGRKDVDAEYIQWSTSVGTSSKSTTASVTNFMNSSATIITFYATTNSPELSMDIADAVAQSYAIEMNNILNNDSVKLLDSAYTYVKSYSAKRGALKKVIKFVLLGIALACVLVVSCEIFDSKVRTVREATINGKLPIIGIIPDYKK